jgi:hypothetical protein
MFVTNEIDIRDRREEKKTKTTTFFRASRAPRQTPNNVSFRQIENRQNRHCETSTNARHVAIGGEECRMTHRAMQHAYAHAHAVERGMWDLSQISEIEE